MPNWRAGWCVGPRYIAMVAPFLIAGIAHAWRVIAAAPCSRSITAGLLIPRWCSTSVSAAVYPHYPTEFDNPVFDLAFPLLGGGYRAVQPGMWLQFPGIWSLAPLALLLLLALSLSIGGEDQRPARWASHAAIAVAIAALCLVPLSRYGRGPNPAEARAAAFVRSTWDPPPRR